jgi:hypothetical protein
MTKSRLEGQQQLPVRPTYEQFRDSFPLGEDAGGEPKLGPLWRSADRWREHLRDEVARITDDPKLTAEGKEVRIAAVHERLAPKIESEGKKAREKAQKLAKQNAERAIPMPGSSMAGSVIKHATELTAIQNEAAAIAQMAQSSNLAEAIEKRTGKRPTNVKGSGDRTLDNLQVLYGEALETPGFEGTIQARAVLRAAKILGQDPEAVYAPFRDERHEEALQEAQRYSQAAAMISTPRRP